MLDRGIIELIGPLGVVRGLKILIKKVSNLQSGLIYHYALTMILGVTFFIILFILPIYFKTGLLLIYMYTYIYLQIKNTIE
jgi:NADH-ubiquinone oxidoreductase chain 5